MLSITTSASINGIDAAMIRIETDISNGLPGMDLVGYLSSEVKEAKERVRIGIKNSGFDILNRKIIVNLSPADIRKSGTQYDLAIALGILICEDLVRQETVNDYCILGELKFNGEISKVNGVISCVIEAYNKGIRKVIVPFENFDEASVIKDMKIIPVTCLKETVNYLNGEQIKLPVNKHESRIEEELPDFSEVKGQFMAKRAAEISAAGMHNLLLAGPPGAGKTMIARRIPSIMPPMSENEKIELTSIYSAAGKLTDGRLIENRPFRSPHHSITRTALIGGGRIPVPGEISYANHGILFMDELPEFNRDNIEVLRQPLEERRIIINRIGGTITYPADFTLVAAMNRCPCGYYPDRKKCKCHPNQVAKYLSKISQPILDRIDIKVDIPAIRYEDIKSTIKSESSASISKRVMRAREMQEKRYAGLNASYNSRLSSKEVEKFCIPDEGSQEMIRDYYKRQEISARSYYRILKTARTIADLEGCEKILEKHIKEALMYRIDALYR
jgi:magnesium chelatase family protein